jgi:hypothetical protein
MRHRMISMPSTMETFRSAPRARRPLRARRFGRAALLAGWAVFALATTLSTCIQAIAAPGDHTQNVAAVSAGKLIDHPLSEGLPTENADEGFASSCCHIAGATPRNVEIRTALTMSEPPSGGILLAEVRAAFPTVGLPQSENLAQHDTPPSPRRLYLRTLHLLI